MRLLGWEPYKRSLKYGVTLIPNSILLLPFAAVIVWLAYKFVEEKMSPLQKIQDDSVGVVQVSDWKCPEKKKGCLYKLGAGFNRLYNYMYFRVYITALVK